MRGARDPLQWDGRGGARGFTYLGVLFAVALLGIALSSAGVVWSTAAKLEREAELLFAGDQIRAAIGRYVEASPGVKQYPRKLEDLLEDKRLPVVRRHLRRLFIDPMTGRADWETVMRPDGSIVGVRSRSTDAPLKKAGFRPGEESFERAESYRDWVFVYMQQAAAPLKPLPPAR